MLLCKRHKRNCLGCYLDPYQMFLKPFTSNLSSLNLFSGSFFGVLSFLTQRWVLSDMHFLLTLHPPPHVLEMCRVLTSVWFLICLLILFFHWAKQKRDMYLQVYISKFLLVLQVYPVTKHKHSSLIHFLLFPLKNKRQNSLTSSLI